MPKLTCPLTRPRVGSAKDRVRVAGQVQRFIRLEYLESPLFSAASTTYDIPSFPTPLPEPWRARSIRRHLDSAQSPIPFERPVHNNPYWSCNGRTHVPLRRRV